MATPTAPVLPAEQIKSDFSALWGSVGKDRLEDATAQRALLVSAHKFAVCFSQLSRAMAGLDDNRRLFLQELASDAIHLVHVLFMGDARGARFYLRSVIESFWRHHYFRDHPVEYGWLHTRSKYYTEIKSLREHCGWLDCFQGSAKTFHDDLGRLYGELSSSVHSTSSNTLVLRSTIEDIRLTVAQSVTLSRDLQQVMKPVLFLCILSEQDSFNGLHINMQNVLLNALTVRQRRLLAQAIVP